VTNPEAAHEAVAHALVRAVSRLFATRFCARKKPRRFRYTIAGTRRGTDFQGTVTQVEQVTQTAAASAEEAASAGAELTSQSAALRTLVGRLEELVGTEA